VPPGVLGLPVHSGLSVAYKVLWYGKSGMSGGPCLCGQALLSTPIRISVGNS